MKFYLSHMLFPMPEPPRIATCELVFLSFGVFLQFKMMLFYCSLFFQAITNSSPDTTPKMAWEERSRSIFHIVKYTLSAFYPWKSSHPSASPDPDSPLLKPSRLSPWLEPPFPRPQMDPSLSWFVFNGIHFSFQEHSVLPF